MGVLGLIGGFQPIPNDTEKKLRNLRFFVRQHGVDDFARCLFGLVMQRARSVHVRRAQSPTLVVQVILC